MCKNNGKVNIALFAAAVLLCLTLFTTHLTSGLYARYTTEASGSDSARVAKWSVSSNMSDEIMALTTDAPDGSKIITLTNASEVAVRFDVQVTATDALLPGMVLTVGDQSWTVTDSDNLTHTFTGVFVAAPDTGTEVTLKIVTKDALGNYTGKISISVHAEQID